MHLGRPVDAILEMRRFTARHASAAYGRIGRELAAAHGNGGRTRKLPAAG